MGQTWGPSNRRTKGPNLGPFQQKDKGAKPGALPSEGQRGQTWGPSNRSHAITVVWHKKRKIRIFTVYITDVQIFQKFRSHLKILGARRVARSTVHTEDPQILRATAQNLVALANGICVHLGYMLQGNRRTVTAMQPQQLRATQPNTQYLYAAHELYLCVSDECYNKQR
jgi:hypothetical protein